MPFCVPCVGGLTRRRFIESDEYLGTTIACVLADVSLPVPAFDSDVLTVLVDERPCIISHDSDSNPNQTCRKRRLAVTYLPVVVPVYASCWLANPYGADHKRYDIQPCTIRDRSMDSAHGVRQSTCI